MKKPLVVLSPWRGGTPRRLAAALGVYNRTPDQYADERKRYRMILNYGVSRVMGPGPMMLNFPSSVAIASNKAACLRRLTEKGVPTLDWTTNADTALEWLKDHSVIAHHKLTAHSGQGLDVISKGSTGFGTKEYRLFTKYFPKKDEARVHVIKVRDRYETLYLLKKRVLQDRYSEFGLEGSPSTYIRTYDNGWIFARECARDDTACELAIRGISGVGLDFGAVDILSKGLNYKIGEINTAPGLEGACLEFYRTNLEKVIYAA